MMVAEIESAGRFEILLPFFSFWKVFSLLLFFALLEDLNSLYFEISFFCKGSIPVSFSLLESLI